MFIIPPVCLQLNNDVNQKTSLKSGDHHSSSIHPQNNWPHETAFGAQNRPRTPSLRPHRSMNDRQPGAATETALLRRRWKPRGEEEQHEAACLLGP